MRPTIALAVASAYSDLVFHVLAHAPAPRRGLLATASSTFDSGYVAWCSDTLDPCASQVPRQDAQLISDLLGRAGEAEVARLSALPFLCSGLDALERIGGDALGDLEPQPGLDAPLLSSLRAEPSELLEIVWCAVLLSRAAWAEAHHAFLQPALIDAIDALTPAMNEAAALAPGLTQRSVSISFVLGARGRAYQGQILVGAPLAHNGHGADTSAVIALHEHAVALAHDVASGSGASIAQAHRVAESLAVAAVRARVNRHPLEETYASWLRGLDLAALDPQPDAALVGALCAAL